MNNNIRVPPGLLHVGASLTHSVYDQAGKLLLRHGAVLETEAMVERLESSGYFDPQAVDALQARAASAPVAPPVGYQPDRSGAPFCVFTAVAAACRQLQALRADAAADLEQGIAALAVALHQCCVIDSDASIAAAVTPLPFPYGVRHPVGVALLTAIVLARLKHDPARMQMAIAAALTMDIGVADLDDDMLALADAGDAATQVRVRAHPAAGVETLLARKVKSPLWLAIVSQHHEAQDGSGYPAGLPGDKVLPEAQLIALVDRYCALITGGPQRPALPVTQALRSIRTAHAAAFAPEMIGALLASLGIYPPGTCVQLVNRETAVVVHRLLDPKHPVVYAIAGPSGVAYDAPHKRMTASQPAYAIERCVLRSEVSAPIVSEQLWPPTLAAAKPLPEKPPG